MTKLKSKLMAVGALSTLLTSGLMAGVPIDLPYPKGELKDANTIMQNVYYVTTFTLLKTTL